MAVALSSPESADEAIALGAVPDERERPDRSAIVADLDRNIRWVSQLEMSRDAANVIAQLELIDMRRDLKQMKLAKEAAKITADMHAARALILARENDRLATDLRRASAGSYGQIMPYTHSLAHCIAHGRDTVIAARRDLYFLRLQAIDRIKTAVKSLAFQWAVVKLRLAMRASRKLAAWKAI